MLALFYIGCAVTTVLALNAVRSNNAHNFTRNFWITMGVTMVWLSVLISSASALTIPSGHVIASDGTITPACETEDAQQSMASDNFHIFGGCLCVQALNETVTIDLDDLRGLSRNEVKDFLISEISSSLSDAAIDDVMDNLEVDDITEVADEVAAEVAAEVDEVVTNLADTLTRDEKVQIIADTLYNGNRWYTEKSWDANGFEGILDGTYDGNWNAKQRAADCIAAGGDC